MSFDITDGEKKIASDAIILLDKVTNLLDLAQDHLDIMYNPFKKYQHISSEALHKKRGKLYIFKKQVKKNFEEITYVVFKALQKITHFGSDLKVKELISSLETCMDKLKRAVEDFFDCLDNYDSPDFREKILNCLEQITKEIEELDSLVKERVISFLEENILARSWVSSTGKDFQEEIKEKVPLISELFDERQNALQSLEGNVFPTQNARPQSLDPGSASSVWMAGNRHAPGNTAGEY